MQRYLQFLVGVLVTPKRRPMVGLSFALPLATPGPFPLGPPGAYSTGVICCSLVTHWPFTSVIRSSGSLTLVPGSTHSLRTFLPTLITRGSANFYLICSTAAKTTAVRISDCVPTAWGLTGANASRAERNGKIADSSHWWLHNRSDPVYSPLVGTRISYVPMERTLACCLSIALRLRGACLHAHPFRKCKASRVE